MESRPGFVSAAIRHVPQRGLWTPAALSSASSQTTHLAALQRPPGSMGMGLFYPAGLRPQPAPTHPWGCRPEINHNDGLWTRQSRSLAGRFWSGPRVNLQKRPAWTEPLRSASQQSWGGNHFTALWKVIWLCLSWTLLFFIVLQKASCKMLWCTANSKCLHLSGWGRVGGLGRHLEASL